MKKIEFTMENLGYFTSRQIDYIKATCEGKTFMNFEIHSSNQAGNHILIVGVDSNLLNIYSMEELKDEIIAYLIQILSRGY